MYPQTSKLKLAFLATMVLAFSGVNVAANAQPNTLTSINKMPSADTQAKPLASAKLCDDIHNANFTDKAASVDANYFDKSVYTDNIKAPRYDQADAKYKLSDRNPSFTGMLAWSNASGSTSMCQSATSPSLSRVRF
jgi:hypothetical protein